MPRPDPAVAITADRLAARLPYLSTLQLGQVAEHLVNGVDEVRGVHTYAVECDLDALQAAYGAAQQRIAELEGRGLAGHKLGPYVLVPAALLQKLARSRDYSDEELVTFMDELVALVYTEQG